MLLIGKQITTPGDLLQTVAVENVFKAIISPNSTVATLQKRLQAIRMIDEQQYRKLKTALPYLVCATFQPKLRRKENFLYTERFIVDIDHLSAYNLDLPVLKNTLASDPRVELLFTSPSGDGLKALFVLSEKISDSGYYALFYKSFCIKLAAQYQLGGAVDTKTNDVARCCFVSFDPEAWYNPRPQLVEASEYLPEDGDMGLDRLLAQIKETEKETAAQKKELGIETAAKAPLADDILNNIKEKVGVRLKKAPEKTYIQPAELDEIMTRLAQQLQEVDATILKMTPIHYGRQVKIGAGPYWAEVNVFYGQRGASIVGTTKTGSNRELCETLVALLKSQLQPG